MNRTAHSTTTQAADQITPGAWFGPFRIGRQITRNGDRLVFHARDARSDRSAAGSIVLHVLDRALPSETEARAFQRDVALGRELADPGIVTPAATGSIAGTLYATYPRNDWTTLRDRLLAAGPLDVFALCDLARDLTRVLSRLHAAGYVHRNLNPFNVLLDTEGVRIAGVGYATRVSSLPGGLEAPEHFPGDLGCIAPEQTGRLGRPVDHRADHYALGAILYEAATGLPPFAYVDAAGAIHAHLARMPEHPVSRRSSLPESIARIILKLLAKDPEARYQSGHGLLADIETARDRLAAGDGSAFALGTHDVPDRVIPSGRIYGRVAERAALHAMYRRAAEGRGGVGLIAGAPGIGKTTLIQTLQRDLIAADARFIGVKIDPRDTPRAFAAISLVVNAATGQPAGSQASEATLPPQIMAWATPADGFQFGPEQDEKRLIQAFVRFLEDLGRDIRPVVLLFDDLHWADRASVEVIRQLHAAGSANRLLVLASYRPDEVDAANPVDALIREVGEAGGKSGDAWTLTLPPLAPEAVGAFIADTLASPETDCAALADFCQAVTRGNPFHLNRLIQHLERNGAFERGPAGWRWRGPAGGRQLPEDLLSLLLADAGRLAPRDRRLLEIVSCLGKEFQPLELARASGYGTTELADAIASLVAAGLIRPVAPDDGFMENLRRHLETGARGTSLCFVHDRIREAAERLLPADDRDRLRLAIGRRLAAGVAETEWPSAVVDHFNAGRRLLARPWERKRLARANRAAARRAFDALAFELAATYSRVAVELFSDAPDGQASADLELLTFAARMASLTGRFEAMEALLARARAICLTPRDRADIALVLIEASYARNELARATDLGVAALADLGVALPTPADATQLAAGIAGLRDDLTRKGVAATLAGPVMPDGPEAFAVALAAKVTAAAYIARPELLPPLTILQCRLMIERGPVAEALSAFAVLGLMIGEVLGDHQTGYELGAAADAEARRRGWHGVEAHVAFSYNTFLRHWREPLVQTLEGTYAAYLNGVEYGNHRHAGLALHLNGYHAFLAGEPLAELVPRLDGHIERLRALRQPVPETYLSMFRQAIDDLAATVEPETPLEGRFFSARAALPSLEARSDRTGLLFVHAVRCLVHGLSQQWDDAIREGEAAAAFFPAGRGMIIVPVTLFHTAFARLARARDRDGEERAADLDAAAAIMRRFDVWGDAAPNLGWRRDLLRAAMALAGGDADRASTYAAMALRKADAMGCLPEAALAQRLLAHCRSAAGDTVTARRELAEARLRFLRWGAPGCATAIERDIAALRGGATATRAGADMITLVKIAQAMSDDLRLEPLIERVLTLMRETAGARSATLVLRGPDHSMGQTRAWLVSGHLPADGDVADLTERPLSAAGDWLPVHALTETIRSATARTLPGDGSTAASGDLPPHLRDASAFSALALPLVKQGTVIGVVYLEHDGIADLFTAERTQFLELITGQVVNAIENARLYGTLSRLTDELEVRIEQRTRQYLDAEAQMRAVLVHSPIPTFVTRLSDGQVRFVNPRGAAFFGLTVEQALNEIASDWYADRSVRDRVVELVRQHGRFSDLEVRFKDRNGALRWVQMSGETFAFDGEPSLLSTLIDISERRAKDEELRRHAEQDGLTELLNRRTFLSELECWIQQGIAGALVSFDLDRFKWINDTYGHPTGDGLLVSFAARLRSILPADAVLGRIGGDEFAALVPGDIEAIVARCRSVIIGSRAPHSIAGQIISTPVSIGIAPLASANDDVEAALKHADLALYRAKLAGRNTLWVFDQSMIEQSNRRDRIDLTMRAALEAGEFRLDIQPIVELGQGIVSHVEALLRWNHHELGPISPAEFVPIAEENGLIIPIGDWVLTRACQIAAGLTGGEGIAVNISAAQFRAGNLVEKVVAALNASSLKPDRLTLELTETVLLDDGDAVLDDMRRLRDIGVRLSMDDFGIGYSSLSYLRRYPFDEVKIDRSFLTDIVANRESQLIVSAITSLGRGLGLSVIGEGIETEVQLAVARDLGCTHVQGYLLGRPDDPARADLSRRDTTSLVLIG